MTSPTKQYVDEFAASMEAELEKNRHKGDRPGWLKYKPAHHATKAVYRTQDVEDGIMAGLEVEQVRQLAAHAANRLMMTVDSYAHEQGKEEARPAPANLAAARIAKEAPETLAEFAPSVSYEGSPGCEHEDCRAFILGVEVGRLGARLDAKPLEWRGTYHAANREILTRVAAASGYSANFEESGDKAWLFATFRPMPAAPRLALAKSDASEGA
jgi:hypothetical protein